jgi:hypothetical protein
MTMRVTSSPSILLAGLALTAAAATQAHAGSNELSLGMTNRALRSASADAVTPDTLDGSALSYGRELPLDLVPGLAVWAELGTTFGSARGTMFQTLATSVDSVALTIGGRARYQLVSHVAATARIDVGPSHTSLELRGQGGFDASDSGWGAIAVGGVGVDLAAIDRPQFTLGLRFELGYVAASGVRMAPTTAGGAGTLQLAMTTAELGRLDLSGPSFTGSVLTHF